MALGTLPDADMEGDERALFSDINITPLTDVFLLLLIMFMAVAASALQKAHEQRKQVEQEIADRDRSGLKINLPSGATQEIDPTAKSIVVSILASGEVIVNDTKVNEESLDNVFRSAFTKNKDMQVVLKADAGVHHGRVVGVMERAKRAGLTRLAIATAGGG